MARDNAIRTGSSGLFAMGCFAACVVAVCLNFGARMPFGSVDVALHYLVIDQYFDWSPIVDDTMSLYPPLAHAFAALVARVFGMSPFMAMYDCSLGFLFTIYVTLYLALQHRGILSTLIASAPLLAASILLRNSWSIYGFEIIGNYFYAQIAGGAAFLLGTWIVSGRDRSWTELLLLPGIAFAMGWIYPLAQIDFCGSCVVLWALGLLASWRAGRPLRPQLIQAAVLVAALSVSVLAVPAFYFMFRIAGHEGGLNPAIGSLMALRCYNAGLLAAGLALAVSALRHASRRTSFLASAAIATALGAGVQDLAYALGIGSDYAVRKHTFAIATLLIVSMLRLSSGLLERTFPAIARQRLPGFLSAIIANVAAAASVIVLVSTYAADRTGFLTAQEEVRRTPELRERTVALDQDFQPEFNYILSLVDLRNPRALAVEQNLAIPTGYPGQRPAFSLVSLNSTLPASCNAPAPTLRSVRLVRFDCR